MPHHTAASTSPAKSELYRREMRRRRDALLKEYHTLLDHLFHDLESEESAAFEAHMQIETHLFKRLEACLRTSRSLLDEKHGEDEIAALIRRQRELKSACVQRSENLQGRLKNSSLKQRPRRVYEQQNQTMLDISC